MTEDEQGTRLQLMCDVAVLQIKLLVDGLRDALLIPVSLVASILNLMQGLEK